MIERNFTSSALEQQLLLQLGERLKRARRGRRISSIALAKQVGISRTTLHSVESGEPAPAMGTYLRVMSALGLAGDLALVATDAARTSAQAQPLVVKVDSQRHVAQDLQSLLLHREAVRLLKKSPELVDKAHETLMRWGAAGASHTQPLWDEWAEILRNRDWRKALGKTRRAQELRQASPLPTLLPEATRLRIIAEVKALKQGVDLATLAP